ncbi:MAG: glycerol-3-phosphate dehydrogenase, partial [Deltaproteobacteria bacterium]|nr:glycerol-3-phosphate dehydrogenase [Deltaproteobacteria bacterium]
MRMDDYKDVKEAKIGIVGAGSWGTVIANLLGMKGYRIDLWALEEKVKDQIEMDRENKVFLPGFSLSTNIFPSTDIARVVSNKDLVVIVVPSHVMRETVHRL